VENQARDTAAALQGSLLAAHEKHDASCNMDPSQKVCDVMVRAGAAQNALITAAETYCGWSPTNPPADAFAKCVPVKDGKKILLDATANAATFISELKGVL
jgi:hypothetical protein